MRVIRLVFTLIFTMAFLALLFAASGTAGQDLFLLVLISLGCAVIWGIPDLIAAFLPERWIDAREAGRRAAGEVSYSYTIAGEILAVVALVIGVLLYRSGFTF